MNTIRLPLRAVFYYQQDNWVAHCLEFDLIGHGTSKEDALKSLTEAIRLQILASLEHQNAANLFSPADGTYFRMFGEGKHITAGELKIELTPVFIESIEARQYEGELLPL